MLLRYICMTIFNPDNTTHTFKIIPRDYNEISVVSSLGLNVLNESLNANVSISGLTIDTIENGYLQLSFTAEIIENQSYQLKITNALTEVILFRGKAFATNQVTQNYSINE